MNTYPSDLIYRTNVARRRALMAEAATERLAARIHRGRPDANPLLRSLRDYTATILLALTKRLGRLDASSAQ